MKFRDGLLAFHKPPASWEGSAKARFCYTGCAQVTADLDLGLAGGREGVVARGGSEMG